MRKILISLAAALALLILLAGSAAFLAQRADYGWRPAVGTPTFGANPPRVLFDEAHFNASTAGLTGRYWPFAQLLRADGYDLERSSKPFTAAWLERAGVLVIANASGAPKPQMFGINLPVPVRGQRGDPAFSPAEVEAVRSWVERGGSLLLIADHAPFGEAAAALGTAFGITMGRGFVEVPNESSDPLLFSRENARLGAHPILEGRGPATSIQRVLTFTGQSLAGPDTAAILLRLPGSAIEAVPVGDSLAERPAGNAQGLALEFGRGRVVVLGEAAMLTAQVAEGKRFGMNTPDSDNQRFALNVMHWLSRKL